MTSPSLISKVANLILKYTKPDYMDSYEAISEFLSKKSQPSDNPVKSVFKSFDFEGMQVFTYGNEEKSKNMIVYVHGGAYVNEINYQHHLYCMKLSRKLDAFVLAPVYGLAPLHKSQETFDAITGLYKHLLQSHKNITLMGDSAGGGFVLSFAQYLKTVGLAQPDHIITFSPWVDISMSNTPYDSENDPILGEIGLKEIGKSWAGSLDTKDYRVSPIYGDNNGLADTLIFAGSDEIFHKDIVKYVEKAKSCGVNVKLITGNGMFHIYPLFPIPEAKKAFKEIKKELSEY